MYLVGFWLVYQSISHTKVYLDEYIRLKDDYSQEVSREIYNNFIDM